MPTNRYQKARKFLDEMPKSFSLGYLQQQITILIGGDARTIQAYIQMMLQTKLIKDMGNFRFDNGIK